MKIIKRQQTKIVHANTAEDFEERLNHYLADLSDRRLKYELNFNNSLGFCAYILYTEVTEYPETLAEEFEMRGERHHCTECIYCRIPDDRRFKNFHCSRTGGLVSKASPCCEEFYESLLHGDSFLREEV